MNEVYEAVAAVLKELRFGSREEKYMLNSEYIQMADSELKEANKKFTTYLSKLTQTDQEYLQKYMEIVEHNHFVEQQKLYCQGILDGIQMISGLGLIKENKNIEELLKRTK